MTEFSKIIIEILTHYERFLYVTKVNGLENSDVIFQLYSVTIKSIGKIITKEKRNYRIFRLKYHHILSDESVDEYLFHCLSKIITDILDADNNYARYVQSVVELHLKLISILTAMFDRHKEIVLNDAKVKSEIERYQRSAKKWKCIDETITHGNFMPIYFIPPNKTNVNPNKLKKIQNLTYQAIHSFYSNNNQLIENNSTISDLKESITEQLLDFDDAFAEFEVNFVCQVNRSSILSVEAAEKTMDVAALFAESIEWAHSKCLLRYSQIADCDIELMVSIPRIAILYGCGIAEEGPLSEKSLNCRDEADVISNLAPVFSGHYLILARLRRQLGVLGELETTYLTQLLIQHSQLDSLLQANDSNPNEDTNSRFQKVPMVFSGDLHSLFIMIAGVADKMQTEHASDFRFFMELMFKLFKDEAETELDSEEFKLDTIENPLSNDTNLTIPSTNTSLSSSSTFSSFLTIENSKKQHHHYHMPRLKKNRVDEEAIDALNYSNSDEDDHDQISSSNSVNIIAQSSGESSISSSPSNSTSVRSEPVSESTTIVQNPNSSVVPTDVESNKSDSSNTIKGYCSGTRSNNQAKNNFKKSNTSPNILQTPSDVNTPTITNKYPIVFGCSSQTLANQRPIWRDDSLYPNCCHCRGKFTLLRRRHHCRRCGYVFCNSCWGTKVTLPTFGVTSRVPVCIECEEFVTTPFTASITLPRYNYPQNHPYNNTIPTPDTCSTTNNISNNA